MKERVTLTLDVDLLKQVDASVNGHTIKNRSHAIEMLLIKSLGKRHPIKAIILAGAGKRRLKDWPAPLLREINKKPIIEHSIDLMKKYGVIDITICMGEKGAPLKEHFGSGKKLGVSISYMEEKEPLGTGGALLLKKAELTEPFIVCNADELKEIDVIDMFAFHKEHHPVATVSLTTTKDPNRYGVVRMKGMNIVEFVEKPRKDSPTNLISSGLYILSPEIFNYMPNSGHCMLETDVFPKIAADGRLAGYPSEGQWFDTSCADGFERAQKGWKGL